MQPWLVNNANKTRIIRLMKIRAILVAKAMAGTRNREKCRISLARINRRIARLYDQGREKDGAA